MTNLTPEQRVLGRENAEPGARGFPPRLAQGGRGRAGPGRLLLRLPGNGRQVRRSRPPSSAPATKAARR